MSAELKTGQKKRMEDGEAELTAIGLRREKYSLRLIEDGPAEWKGRWRSRCGDIGLRWKNVSLEYTSRKDYLKKKKVERKETPLIR